MPITLDIFFFTKFTCPFHDKSLFTSKVIPRILTSCTGEEESMNRDLKDKDQRKSSLLQQMEIL